jgi:hypothetical protein
VINTLHFLNSFHTMWRLCFIQVQSTGYCTGAGGPTLRTTVKQFHYIVYLSKVQRRGYFSSPGGPALQTTVNKFQRLSCFIQSTMYRPLPTGVPVLRITVNKFTICSIACYVSYEVLYHDQELYTIQVFGVEAFAITKCDCSSLEHLHWWSASHYGQQN